MDQRYSRPPIVEAVIDLRSKNVLTHQNLDKIKKKLQHTYPFVDAQVTFGVMFSVGQIALNQSPSGHKLTSADSMRIAVLAPDGVSCSRLAPYLGWDDIALQAAQVHTAVLSVESNFLVNRIGVRFINRIDIPQGDIDIARWLTAGLAVPSTLTESIDNFGMQFVFQPQEHVHAAVTVSSQPSPLIDHSAIALDIDVSVIGEFLLKSSEVNLHLSELRQCKNKIFESCITEHTRSQFNRNTSISDV